MGKWLALLCAAQVLSAAAALAQGGSQAALKACQSSDAEERLRGCTVVINAGGFGSQPKLADALDGRCWAYHVKEQFTRAIDDCKASIRIRPRYPYAYNNLGTAYAGLGNYQDAIAAFNAALELKPDFFWPRYNRAKAFAAVGDLNCAADDYEYLLYRDPTNQDIRSRLQQIRSSIGGSKSETRASPPTGGSIPSGRIEVQLNSDGGVLTVPVEINGAITLDFIIDSGASDVSVPADVVSTLIRTRTIRPSDFIGQQTYILADGTEAPSAVFVIRSLKIGGHVVENVRGSIGSPKGSLLLGQSFLRNFRSWSIDNRKHALVLE
jgi:tetratricopeptide (TPR) repeat protein